MNGRCETDPIDQAVNVCGMCFGDYCETCLLKMKGRRHPVCKQCARISSGIAKGEKIEAKGSRNTAKKRREEYADAPRERAEFVYFDEEEDYVSPLPPEAPRAKGRRAAKKAKKEAAKSKKTKSKPKKNTSKKEESEKPSSKSIKDKLKDSALSSKPEPEDEVEENDESYDDGNDSAVLQLEEIQKYMQPKAPSQKPPPREEAAPPAPLLAEPEPAKAKAKKVPPTQTKPKKQAKNKAAAMSEPDLSGNPFEDERPPAPVPASKRKEKPQSPTSSGKKQSATALAEPSTANADRADIDENGDWVPPLLRGMDPNASDAKAELPKRKRRKSD